MANDREPAKLLLPYLQRADELQKHEPLVAYYCRLYAMERGMKIAAKERTKTTSALLISLMNQLEKDKKSLTLGPDDHLYVEGFASNVFAKADKQDRAGRADLNTAKTFYAASIFFEILTQFGEVQTEIEQKQKYAVWKAAEIRKAIKEGRRPEPGPPGGDQDLSGPVNSSWGENSSPEHLGQENSQAGQQNVSSVSMPIGGTKSEPLSQFPGNLQQYSADRITKSEPLSQFPGNLQQYSADRITKSEPLSQIPQNLQQYSADRITKSEPLSQFPQNLQHYSADKMQPPTAFSSGDYQTAASHSQAPQDYSQYSESNQTAYPSSYYTMPATPQDTHGGQVSAGYSYSMMAQSHDSSNASQPYPLNYQSYPTMRDGSLDSQPLSHSSYPSTASYYQNINGNHPSAVPYVNPPSNQEFQSNLQYSSVAGTNGGYRESTPLERTSSAPATAPAPAPAPALAPALVTAPAPALTTAPAAAYSYNSSYQPPPEKIAEAHKAARFAVGALAFDDVPTAVEHLKRSLEMLTLPSTS